METLARIGIAAVTAFYAYGAVVHGLNIAGLGGFDWAAAPRKWQYLDIAYLVIDLIVVAGLWRLSPLSLGSFYLASLSQLVLYTFGRGWILDVPPDFAPDAGDLEYLDWLVLFHVAALAAVTFSAYVLLGKRLEPLDNDPERQ